MKKALESIIVMRKTRFGPELLSNPGFETAGAGGADVFANWVETAGDGTISDETTLVHSGSHACKQERGTTVIDILQQLAGIVPGQSYHFTFWTRGDGTNAGRYAVYDVTHATGIIAVTSTGVSGTTYTKVSVDFTAPAGCVEIQLLLYTSAVNSSIAYFDDVSLRKNL